MLKHFVAVVAVLGFVAIGTAVTAEFYPSNHSPAPAEAKVPEARYQLISRVIDGELSLLESAAAFRDLNRKSPVVADILVEVYPGDTEGESACQQVLACVRAELEGRAKETEAQQGSEVTTVDPAAAVLARLKAELAAARGKDGNVRLLGDAS